VPTSRKPEPVPKGLSRALAALGSGFLVALSLPPWGFWPLALIGVTCFMALGLTAIRARDRAGLGFMFGLGWLAMGCGWMWQLTPPGYIAAALVFAGAHGLAGLISWQHRAGFWALPAAHTLIEAVRFSFPFGGVPLASLGISQVAGPLAGTARIVGVIGVTWVVFQLGAAVAELTLAWRVRRARTLPSPRGGDGQTGLMRTGAMIGALLVPVVLIVIAQFAPQGSATGETIRIASVQGGGRQGTSALQVPASLVATRHLEATAQIPVDPQLDLVLWPENVLRIRDLPFANHPLFDQVWAQARRLGVPFAVGITEDADLTGRGQPGQITNAHVTLTPEGFITDRYDKVRRVPFGEYVPLRGLLETLGAPVDQVLSDAVAGSGPAVLNQPGLPPMAVVISWEVFFGGRAREGVKQGGQLLLNPTNGASYTGTIVQTQQVASSRLRAIETGRWVMQVAPTGFSAVVNAEGKVLQRSAVSETRVITADVELRTGQTWYTRIGDGPVIWLLIAIWVVTGLVEFRSRAALSPDRR
jgi:apolipoprotein N-acyltransferase